MSFLICRKGSVSPGSKAVSPRPFMNDVVVSDKPVASKPTNLQRQPKEQQCKFIQNNSYT